MLLDAFSRRVVGWPLDRQLTAALPRAALRPPVRVIAHLHRAQVLRRPIESTQYASTANQTVLQRRSLQPSMSRLGDCWDNAVVESFLHSLKVERLHERRYETREQLQQDLEDYIERFYNRQRRHSTLGYVSPAMFELQHAA
ncbi:MAG TPA: integrase core domain-containing protein [Gemmatimonadales bacterium]|nr:integrase core domain-containing protein [Gemmatimonadales bacterium]